MIEIPFAPDLELGPVRVAWHSIFALVGSALAGAIAIRLSRRLIRDERVYAYASAVLLGGLLTARLGHIADNWDAYAAAPDRLAAFWGGGIAVIAAPIGSTIAGLIAARRLRLPSAFMLDVAAIGIVLGLAVGRIGDVINGEHHAAACAGLAWCVRYTHPETLGQSGPVHPVVVYDALLDLAIAALAYAFWRGARAQRDEGRTYLLILGLYGAGRAATSLLRLDPVVLWGLQEAQILGLLYAVVALPLFFLRGRPRSLA
ncbi:MAG: prolipoprotein diacylglyceryl transferase [Chloroflexi bacterium]|nr:prolipoprotein diacylglyceryl transferase [Chloroflexota bacterium]